MNQQQNDERFAELLRAHHTQLFGYLWALVHNAHDAEDLYQQTSIVLWKKFDGYREGTSFFHWAMAAARYEILNFRRVRERRRQFNAELQTRLTHVFEELDTSLLEARLESLHYCKEQLVDADRDLLKVCYSNARSFREIAAELGRSPKSIYNALVRIRAALLKCIEARVSKQERGA